MNKSFLIASGNKHKIQEILNILSKSGLNILSGLDMDLPVVEEDQNSLEGNSLKKAQTISLATNRATIADDTGLFVDALDGKPGIYAARYAGEGCNFADNRKKLLSEMSGAKNRNAYFATVISFCDNKGNLLFTSKGIMKGKIALQEQGSKGFGYDNIFIPEGFEQTLGQLDSQVKNEISHRGKALKIILPRIVSYFNN